MQSQQSQNTLIAGCQYITDSVKKGILGNFFEQIFLEGIHTPNSSCFGTKPSRFPCPNITPVHVACNAAAVLEAIEGLPLTWVEINSLSKWGVYYKYIALFGERHWVTTDRSGALFVREFDLTELFI